MASDNFKWLEEGFRSNKHKQEKQEKQTKLNLENSESLLCSEGNRITSGFSETSSFQRQTQDFLKTGDLEKAFKKVEEYIKENKHKFYRLLNTETGKIHIAKQLNRFDKGYIYKTKKQLEGLKNIGVCDIMHITLTLTHTESQDYISEYEKLKKGATGFIEKFKDLTHNQHIKYFMTYECKKGKDNFYHQHLHLLIFEQGFLNKTIIMKLKRFWYKKTGGKYVFFKYISKDRNYIAFNYAVKYVVKEVGNVSLTTAILFSVKGKAYSMSLPLQEIMRENRIIKVDGHKFLFIDSFKPLELLIGYKEEDYDKDSLLWFYSQFPPDMVENIKKHGILREQEKQKIEQQEQQREQEVKEMLKKNTYKIHINHI